MDPFLGEIVMFAGNFAPRGWALCEGQLLPINQYSALFSILGTTYGGDGRTTFALPDLRGRFPLQQGNGPGLPTYRLGEKGGNYQTTLLTQNLPPASIAIKAYSEDPTTDSPENAYMALSETNLYSTTTDSQMGHGSIVGAANLPFSNQPPYLGINYIIALQGVFPSRN